MKQNLQKPAASGRTDSVLRRKFIQYLIPAMLTTAAMSLSEFVDSMIVSGLLGNDAMAIVQLGYPVILVSNMLFMLIGNGGSVLYAVHQGARDHDRASGVFIVSLLAAVFAGLLIPAVGLIFFGPISGALCTTPDLAPQFNAYYTVLLLSLPFLIIIMSLVCFLPAAGSPVLATVVNVVANVVNIGMDYVYIRVFGMGVEGAAWATLTGYAAGCLVMLFAFLSGKVRIRIRGPRKKDLQLLPEILKTGSTNAMNQLGFALKFGICNSLATAAGGKPGLVAFTLCAQSLSVVSIVIAGITDAHQPLAGMLHGQQDQRGKLLLLKKSMLWQFGLSAVCVLFFLLFPHLFAALYSITEPDTLRLSLRALRIFSLMYLIRGFYVVFMCHLKVIGHKAYSTAISVADGFLLIVPVCALMISLMGIDGLWWAYPLTSVLIAAGCVLINLRIARKHPESYRGLLLEEIGAKDRPLIDTTLLENDQDISTLSETVQQKLEKNGVAHETAIRTALLLEEMAVYLRHHSRKKDYIDILMRAYPDRVVLDFRSIGAFLNPAKDEENDIQENIRLLRKLAGKIESTYIMGMNNIRITLNAAGRKGADA